MSFEETVLINFKAQENVSSTISKLNGEFQKLGNNKSLVNIKNNIDSYIKDTQRWKQALQDLEKANPQILKNTNFQEIKAQVESLQKAFQFSKDTFQRQAKWFQPGVGQPAKDLAVQSIRDGFAASEANLGFHKRLSDFFTNEGIDRTPAELTKELEPPHKEKPDIDKTTTEKESQNLSKDIVNIDKSIKKLDSAIDKVVSALDKFNRALTSATAKDTKQTTLTPDTSKFTSQNTEVPLTNPNIGVPVGGVQALDKETYNTSKRQQAIESLSKSTVTYNKGIGQSSKYMRESTAAQLPMVIGQRNLSKAFEETAVSSDLFKRSANPSEFSSYTGKFQGLTTAIGELSMGLGQAQGLLAQFFGLIGSGNAVMDMFTAASERQTNQIMLQMNRTKESADSTYRFIQDLVVRLPGNDQFLNQLLNQTAAMNPDMSNEDLGTIGTATANYYMLARAKGQNNYETERELRSYLLTGETLALRNSVLSSEIKLLKQGNTVYERSILLQKAMSNVGMDGIATYDSMSNAMEELRGHFQKAFADTGEILVAVVHPLVKLYNAIDNLTGTKLSAALIIIGVALGFVLSAALVLTTAFYALGTTLKGALSFLSMMSKMKQFISFMDGWRNAVYASKTALTELTSAETAETIVSIRSWIAKRLGIAASFEADIANNLEAESEEHLSNAIKASTQEQVYNTLAGVEGERQTYYQAMAKQFGATAEKEMELAVEANNERIAAQIALEKGDTIATNLNTGSTYVNIRAKISHAAAVAYGTVALLYDIFVKRDEIIITQIETLAEKGNVYAKILVRINTVLETFARFGNISTLNSETLMTGVQTLAEEGNVLAKVLVRISTGAESLARRINAASTDMETEALSTQLVTKLKDLVFKARDIALSVVQCARRVIHIALIIAEAVAVTGLEAAWTVLDATITAATGGLNKVILGIIVGVVVLIGAVYEVGKYFGWWSSITDAIHVTIESICNMLRSIPILGNWFGGSDDVKTGTVSNNAAMSNPQNMRTGQQLTQTYNNTSNNSPYVVNNNFGEGSVQTDARNMTSKEVRQLFTGAFGKNNPRGV